MFSQREEAILKIIGRKKMTLRLIAEELFTDDHPSDKPMEPEITVGNTIRRIIKKCKHHNLDWTLVRKKMGGKLLISKEKLC
jgi:hypothetical protein